jgi:crotonobetaine/carnitine-CoA ligase
VTGVWVSGRQTTILELLERRLETDPDGPYLDIVGTSVTARDVGHAANRLASALSELGVAPGDRIATLLDNSVEGVLVWFGTLGAGGISVPINTAYKGDYLIHQLRDSGSRVIVVHDSYLERVEAILVSVPDLRHVVVVGEHRPITAAVSHRWDDLLTADDRAPDVTVRPGDLATFIYTGGTTGPSKGCMLSHNYHEILSRQINTCWRRTAADVAWAPLPLFHFNAYATVVVGTLVSGGRGALSGRFSVSGFWPEVNRVDATIVTLLGSMAYLVAHDADRPEMPKSGAASANRTVRILAAAPMPDAVDRRVRDRFGVDTFSGAFGLTEASLVSWQPVGVENKPNAAGVINHEYFDVRIFDDDDNELPTGNDGEIVLRPKRPHVMFEGYWGNPQATVRMSRNWWYHTGDIGRIDEDDYLFFVDRKKDYLRRRGENISSQEVEGILLKHGDLVDVAVHAVPSEVLEDDLKVTAVLRPGATVTEEELFRWCIDELPYFAMPRYVEFRDDLPRSPVGRVLKRELREEGVTPATWDAVAAGVVYERR